MDTSLLQKELDVNSYINLSLFFTVVLFYSANHQQYGKQTAFLILRKVFTYDPGELNHRKKTVLSNWQKLLPSEEKEMIFSLAPYTLHHFNYCFGWNVLKKTKDQQRMQERKNRKLVKAKENDTLQGFNFF